MNKNSKKAVSIICIIVIGLLLLIPAVTLLIMSVKDFSPVRGLIGSPNVGLDNITTFLTNSNTKRVLGNTLMISVLSMIIGAVYLMFAYGAIGAFEEYRIKLVLTFVFVLPALIPVNAYSVMLIKLLPRDILINSSFILQAIAAAENGLRFSAVFVMGALFSTDNHRSESIKYILAYVGVRLIHILTLDTTFLNDFANPLTYECLDCFGTYAYRTGLMQGQFSMYAGGYVAGLVMQLLPAVLGGVLLIMPVGKKTWQEKDARSSRIPAGAAVLPVGLLLLVLTSGWSGSLSPENLSIGKCYMNGMVIAAGSAILVVLLGMILAGAALEWKIWGVWLLVLLYFISDKLLGPYLLVRERGLLNTALGTIMLNLYWTAPAALIGTVILGQQYSRRKVLSVAVAGLGIAFAWFWGDDMPAMVVMNRADGYPISSLIQQLISGGVQEQLSIILYILVPVLVGGAGIVGSSFWLRKEEQK